MRYIYIYVNKSVLWNTRNSSLRAPAVFFDHRIDRTIKRPIKMLQWKYVCLRVNNIFPLKLSSEHSMIIWFLSSCWRRLLIADNFSENQNIWITCNHFIERSVNIEKTRQHATFVSYMYYINWIVCDPLTHKYPFKSKKNPADEACSMTNEKSYQ